MEERLYFAPPSVEFDPRLANELARLGTALPVAEEGASVSEERRSPLVGYSRSLTAEGGVLICYRDQDRHPVLTALRVLAWLMATGLGGWLIFFLSPLSFLEGLLAFVLLTTVITLMARARIIVTHSIEIRPDTLIIDGEDVFYASDIGENWPQVEMKDEDPDRMVVAGICGTRWLEYTTANRLAKNDATPEVLAADLENAIEQLWGRREVTFATAD